MKINFISIKKVTKTYNRKFKLSFRTAPKNIQEQMQSKCAKSFHRTHKAILRNPKGPQQWKDILYCWIGNLKIVRSPKSSIGSAQPY